MLSVSSNIILLKSVKWFMQEKVLFLPVYLVVPSKLVKLFKILVGTNGQKLKFYNMIFILYTLETLILYVKHCGVFDVTNRS